MFLSANEKCWLLLTTSGRFFQKDLIINHSSCLFFVRYLEESLMVWNWKVLEGLEDFTVIAKLITTCITVAFIN